MDKYRVKVYKQEQMAGGIFSLWLVAPEISETARAGQFVSLYTDDPSRLLPRPISICDTLPDEGLLRLVYRVAGAGTEQFSRLTEGDSVDVLGPLGNGYEINTKRPVLLGGGIGIPPMLRLARTLHESGIKASDIRVVLGFRDESFLVEEFSEIATVYITSDTGAIGLKGNVIDGMREYCIKDADMLYSCGPTPMLRAVREYSEETGIPAQISLEERMACGIGACLACVAETTETDDHSKVHNTRICKDGPVFDAREVIL